MAEYVEFKANFHYVSIKGWKDPEKKWYDLPYLEMDDAIIAILESWPADWRTVSYFSAWSSKSIAKWKKEEARLKMEQLAKKRRKDAKDKDKAERVAKTQVKGEEEEDDHDSNRNYKSPIHS